MRKLNLGCGFVLPEDWVNVDKLDYEGNIIADVLTGLPFKDNEFDFVLSNHTLQMFKYEELPVALREIHRVMKPGATLRILTPDMDKAILAYQTGWIDYFPIGDELEPTIGGKFARYLFWHGDTHCAFSKDSLEERLKHAGFTIPEKDPVYGECELDSRERESLIVEAVK